MVRAGIKEAHPAGIWSDLSIDGPVIGTLIVVLDKAKNLPNRKKIGKQDPYAVARLGKEAKRTDTDVRGGQTPRWDKELRFPVRNSPDYRTLKITVFNDDKKTDLIGECNLRLDKILVTGGGTDDGWRGLKCKDKYAGEILVELTFWDMRPTPGQRKKSDDMTIVKEKEVSERKARDPLRKIGGAREMGPREKVTRRRPLPSDPSHSREDLNLPSKPAPQPARATRRSRHSQPQIHQSHQSYSEPPRLNRESRGSRPISVPGPRGIAVTPAAVNPGNIIYDPYGQDSHIPAGEILGRYDEPDDPNGQFESPPPPPPPPPPPEHSRNYQADGRHHSSTNIATQLVLPSQQQQHSSGHRRQKSLLRHYQSVPDWRFYQQKHSPTDQQIHKNGQGFEQYGGSYPGPQNNFPSQGEYDDRLAPPPNARSSRHPNLPRQTSYDGWMRHEDGSPGLSYGPTPTSSMASLRNNDNDAPPPPPPHARKPAPMRMEEPNWHNTPPLRTLMVQDLGLPSYDDLRSHGSFSNSIVHEPRAPSRGMDMSPSRNGVPLPPSLVPGIDPTVVEQMTERIEKERRMGFNGVIATELVGQLQIEAGPQSQSRQMQHVSSNNYHRPQVEEVQDIALYQPQLLPEEQVVERTTKKKKRSAPMVKPIPIHGERNDPVSSADVATSVNKRNSMLVTTERKSVPAPEPKPLEGLPFSPDSFNVINPGPAVEAEAKKPRKMISPGINRVLDGSDILPPESFAPEPEAKRRSPHHPPPVPENRRKERLSPLPPRKPERLALPAPPPPPVPTRDLREPRNVAIEIPKKGERDRNKHKKVRNSQSMALLPSNSSKPEGGGGRNRHSIGPGAMVMYNPQNERVQRHKERESERAERDSRALVPAKGHGNYGYKEPSGPNYTGMEVASYAPTSKASYAPTSAPPVPAKIPLQSGQNSQLSKEDYLLSQEMSLINIGPVSGGRTRRGRY